MLCYFLSLGFGLLPPCTVFIFRPPGIWTKAVSREVLRQRVVGESSDAETKNVYAGMLLKPFSFYNRLLADRRNFAGATFEPRKQKGIDRLKILRFDNVIDDVLRKGSIHGQKLHTFGLWVIQGG